MLNKKPTPEVSPSISKDGAKRKRKQLGGTYTCLTCQHRGVAQENHFPMSYVWGKSNGIEYGMKRVLSEHATSSEAGSFSPKTN